MSEPTARKNTQTRLIDLFDAEGVRVITGIVDVHFMDFHKAAVARGIRMIGPRHEVCSAMIADGAARMTGRPQVAMAALGPGVANLVGGVICAHSERVPMVVVVTGRSSHSHAVVRRGRFQHFSQIELFKPITKYAAVVQSAEHVDEVVREAFRQVNAGTPGPAYIEIPAPVMWQEADFAPPLTPAAYRMSAPQAAAAASIEQAADLLAAAEFPVIVAGQGIHVSRTHGDLKRIADVLHCAVIPSYGGRGALPETDPRTLMFGFSGANTACAEADVVLAVGTSIGEPLHFGQVPRWGNPGEQKWIHIDRDPANINVNRQADVAVVGDLRAALPQIAAALKQRGPFANRARLAELRAELDAFKRQIADSCDDRAPMHPGRAIMEVRAAVPDDAIIVRDGGCTALWEMFLNEQRSNDLLWTSHIGHLGCGLPYAIGARLVTGNDRPIVLISGDGAIGFQFMEFETAVRCGLPFVAVVNCDGHWAMELMDSYGGLETIDTHPNIAMAPTRFDRMVEALGGHGEYCERIEDVRPAVERALASGKPALVQLMTDVDVNANVEKLPGVEEFLNWYGLDGEGGYGVAKPEGLNV